MSNIDKFLNNAIKTLLVTLICVMLTIGVVFFTPPVFADSSDVFEIQYITPTPSISYTSLQPFSWAKYYNNYFSAYRLEPVADYPFYMFRVGSYLYVATSSNFDIDTTSSTNLCQVCYNNGSSFFVRGSDLVKHPNYDLYVFNYDNNTINYVEAYCPTYTTTAEGYSAIEAVFNYETPSYDRTISIKAGYAAYAVCNGGYVELNTTFPHLSKLISSGNLWDSNQRIGYSQTFTPSSGYVFNSNSGSLIPWSKLSTSTNSFGQTKQATYLLTDLPSDGTI